MTSIRHNDTGVATPRRGNSFRVNCPHCTHQAIARSTDTITPLFRNIYYQCGNIACGHTFVATLEIARTLNPSLIPNPAIRLPFGPPRADRGTDRLSASPTTPAPIPANDTAAPPDRQSAPPNTG